MTHLRIMANKNSVKLRVTPWLNASIPCCFILLCLLAFSSCYFVEDIYNDHKPGTVREKSAATFEEMKSALSSSGIKRVTLTAGIAVPTGESIEIPAGVTVSLAAGAALTFKEKQLTGTGCLKAGGGTIDCVFDTRTIGIDEYIRIYTNFGLTAFGFKVNAGDVSLNAILEDDIIFDTTIEDNFTPIGTGAPWPSTGGIGDHPDWGAYPGSAGSFEGIFDGNGRSISGLNMRPQKSYGGLFGHNSGTIKNFTIRGSLLTSITLATFGFGGTAGVNGVGGTVTGVISYVTVTGTGVNSYAYGGIVGRNSGLITRCVNNGAVSGKKHVGGIAGDNFDEITLCVNNAAITGLSGYGKDGIGGIAGMNGNKSSLYNTLIQNCYNTGTCSNPNAQWVGGITGMADGTSTVENCYDVGAIGSYYGWSNPIIGQNEGTVTNCYYREDLKIYDDNGIGATGLGAITSSGPKTDDEMKAPTFVTQLGTAYISDTDINNGYPILAWQAD